MRLLLLPDETWPLLQKPPLLDNSEGDGKVSKEILDFLPLKAIGGSSDPWKIKRCDPIYTPSYKACHTTHTWLCNQKCPKVHWPTKTTESGHISLYAHCSDSKFSSLKYEKPTLIGVPLYCLVCLWQESTKKVTMIVASAGLLPKYTCHPCCWLPSSRATPCHRRIGSSPILLLLPARCVSPTWTQAPPPSPPQSRAKTSKSSKWVSKKA